MRPRSPRFARVWMGCRPRESPVADGYAYASVEPATAVDRRGARHAAAAPDTACGDGLELRSAVPDRAEAVPETVCIRGRMHFGGSRSGLRCERRSGFGATRRHGIDGGQEFGAAGRASGRRSVFGARFRSGQKNLKDYFLGGRTAPWWAISLSIVSAETSTLTIVGTPALAFGGNLGFLQIVLGYLLARIVISAVFLPQ